jgi:hypothetical protein
VATDLPGYGGSAPTASGSKREMAAGLVEVMADLGFERFFDCGCLVAWCEADNGNAPATARRLTAVGRASPGPATTGLARQELTEPGAGS